MTVNETEDFTTTTSFASCQNSRQLAISIKKREVPATTRKRDYKPHKERLTKDVLENSKEVTVTLVWGGYFFFSRKTTTVTINIIDSKPPIV